MARKHSTHAKLQEQSWTPSTHEILRDLKTKLAIAEKQRDDALKTLIGQANVVKTLAVQGDLLDAVEQSVKRLKRIAQDLAAFAVVDRGEA